MSRPLMLRPPGCKSSDRSFLTDHDGFTTEFQTSSDSSSSDSDSDAVSTCPMYRELKKSRKIQAKCDIKHLLEKDKKQLAYETNKVDKMKNKLRHQRQELTQWEKNLRDLQESRKKVKKLLIEADTEHEKDMIEEEAEIVKERIELQAEFNKINEEMKGFEKNRRMKSTLLEVGPRKISEIKSSTLAFKKMVDDLVALDIRY